MNTAELKAIRVEFKAYLEAHPDAPQSLSSAMQQVVCAIDTALINPREPKFIDQWLDEARTMFDAAREKV